MINMKIYIFCLLLFISSAFADSNNNVTHSFFEDSNKTLKQNQEKSIPKIEVNIGLQLSGLLKGYEDARNLAKNWFEEITKTDNIKVNVHFYQNIDLLYKDFKDNKLLDMVVIDPYFYYGNSSEIDKIADNFWSIATSEDDLIQKYLVARRDLDFKNFKDIKNRVVVLKKSDYKVDAWIDKQSYISNKKAYKKLVKKVIYEKDESSALLQVFFKKADLALISKKTWDTMVDLNPGIKKRVKIVAKSKKIYIPIICFFNKNSSNTFVDSYFKLSLNMREVPKNEQIRIMLKFDHVFKLNKEKLESLKLFFKEYKQLQLKYTGLN